MITFQKRNMNNFKKGVGKICTQFNYILLFISICAKTNLSNFTSNYCQFLLTIFDIGIHKKINDNCFNIGSLNVDQ